MEVQLEKDTPKWKTQDSVTIYFPEDNNLERNDFKIAEIIKKDKLRKVGVKFLADYEALNLHSESVLGGEVCVAQGCAATTRKLQKLSTFIEEYKDQAQEGGFSDFNSLATTFDNIFSNKAIDSADRETVESAMKFLAGMKQAFLLGDEVDDFATDMKAYFPY